MQRFIKSHKAKLEQERENLGMTTVQSRTSGILPQDTATSHREQLRRERQTEYQAFLLRQQQTIPSSGSHQLPESSRDSLAVPTSRSSSGDPLRERRRALARDREHELQSSHHRDRGSPRNQEFVSAAADQHSHRGRAEVGEGGRMSSPGRGRVRQ